MPKKSWGKVMVQSGFHETMVGRVLTISFVGEDSIKAAEAMLDRALNCWDEGPNELKALGDCVKFGEPLQAYGGVVQMNGKH